MTPDRKVYLDGEDISSKVREVSLEFHPGAAQTVSLKIIAAKVTVCDEFIGIETKEPSRDA